MSELRQRKAPTAGEVEEKVQQAQEYAKEKTMELTAAMKKKQEETERITKMLDAARCVPTLTREAKLRWPSSPRRSPPPFGGGV